MACGILVSPPGIKPPPPALEGGVLTTRLPGKSKIPVSNKLYKSGIIVWLLFKCPLGPIHSFSQH